MEYKKQKVDRRVLYTKRFLRESLLELMKEKPIGRITPTELCRRADINRNTFYAHYNSPEALLQSIEEELYDQIRRSLDLSPKNANIWLTLTEICEAIRKNGDLCKVIISERGDKEFLKRVINIAREKCLAEWKAAGMSEEGGQMEMLYAFTASGSVAIVEQWIQEDMKKSPEEIARFLAKASAIGLQVFMK